MKVLIPLNRDFNYFECKNLYTKYQRLIGDIEDFDKILISTLFYSFISDEGKFIGCLYFYKSGDRLFVNGFSNRNCHLQNIECLNMAEEWFDCDIWAKTKHMTAKFCLKRAGFKQVDSELYVKKKGE